MAGQVPENGEQRDGAGDEHGHDGGAGDRRAGGEGECLHRQRHAARDEDADYAEHGGGDGAGGTGAAAYQPRPSGGWLHGDAAETGDAELREPEDDHDDAGGDLRHGPDGDRQLDRGAERAQQGTEHGVGDELTGEESGDGGEVVGQPRGIRGGGG
jgi:hypothetical protein